MEKSKTWKNSVSFCLIFPFHFKKIGNFPAKNVVIFMVWSHPIIQSWFCAHWLNLRDKNKRFQLQNILNGSGFDLLGLNCSTSCQTVVSATSASTLFSDISISLTMTHLTKDPPQLCCPFSLYLKMHLSSAVIVSFSHVWMHCDTRTSGWHKSRGLSSLLEMRGNGKKAERLYTWIQSFWL